VLFGRIPSWEKLKSRAFLEDSCPLAILIEFQAHFQAKMSTTAPRRSPRLANKAATLQPTVTLQPQRSKEQRNVSTRISLLNLAYEIYHDLVYARIPDDFRAVLRRLEHLERIADKLITSDIDEWFITDTMLWTRRATRDAIEHKYAIEAIKEYITCLKARLS